jgi:hypothetical protein
VWLAQSLHPDPDLNYSISKRRLWSGLVFLMRSAKMEGKGREWRRQEDRAGAGATRREREEGVCLFSKEGVR